MKTIKKTKQFEQYFNDLKQLLKYSYVPYSKFKTAAIVATDLGNFKGVNVENASFPLTNCAERSAIFAAVSNGAKKFKELYLISSSERDDITPCGACRQVLAEFMESNSPIYVFNIKGNLCKYTLGELLPQSFKQKQLFNK